MPVVNLPTRGGGTEAYRLKGPQDWNGGGRASGGNADGSLTGLRGKRVGIIGTGATAVQCIPHLAQIGEHIRGRQIAVFRPLAQQADGLELLGGG